MVDDDTSLDTNEQAAEQLDPVASDHAPPAAAATDDDWLRSRTNRLLDLVDPEDLEAGQASQGGQPSSQAIGPAEPAEQDTRNDRDSLHSSGEVTHDRSEDAVATSQGPAHEDAASTIARTSRIFVRNLPYSATEDDLRETFEKFGALQEVRYLQRLALRLPPHPPPWPAPRALPAALFLFPPPPLAAAASTSEMVGRQAGANDEPQDRDSLHFGV